MFTAAGTLLAWTTLELDAESLTPLPKLKLLDPAATPTAPTTVDAFGTHVQEGHFLSLAVGSTGTLAWVLDRGHHDPAPDDPVELKARKPNGATVTLDHATNAALGHLAIAGVPTSCQAR